MRVAQRARRSLAGTLLALAIASSSAHAQSWNSEPPPALDEIELRDGSVLRGRIVEELPGSIVIETTSLGRIEIKTDAISRIIRGSERQQRQEAKFDPDVNSILLGPTPETIPRGSTYFRNFEILILNAGVGITDDLNASFGMLFPVSTTTMLISLGLKYRLVSRETFPLGVAVAAGVNIVEDQHLSTVSFITGIGDRRRSLNLSVHGAFTEDTSESFFIAGGDVQVGGSFKFLLEYANSTDAVVNDTQDIAGFLNLGFRLFGEVWSFSLTGVRPLAAEDADDLLLFPLAAFSRHW